MRAIPIEYVPVGARLGDTLYSNEGIMLAKAGIALSENLLDRIRQNQIFTLYIADEHSDVEISRILEPNVINKGMLIIKSIFSAASFRNTAGEHKPQSIMEHMDDLNEVVEDILDAIFRSRNLPLEYVVIKSLDNYLYMSALNCGLLSAMMATALNYNRDMVKQLFLAGVFHDIGMAFLPKDILQKRDTLSLEEKMQILSHPISGHHYLKDKNFLSAYVKQATLQHHEKLDGTGYPNRVQGEALSLNAQIVGIADIYDAMTSDRPYRRANTPLEAIEFLLGSAGSAFDPQLVQVFTSKIHPFPPGSLVALNTGQYAVVDSVPPGLPLRPSIRIISGGPGRYQYQPVDLVREHTLIITGIVYQLPEKL